MKNYYDELEVSKTASKEVIEKVYKVLAKKYHPDTTKEADKQAAEEKFKIISEAYEILSDDEKRKKYDLELEQSNPTISYEEYINVVNQRNKLNDILNKLKYSSTTSNYNNINSNFNNTNYQYTNTNYNNQNINRNNYTNTNSNLKKKRYYYTNTGKPASAFDYFKYKIKELFTNIILFILSVLVALLIVDAFTNFNFLDFLYKISILSN